MIYKKYNQGFTLIELLVVIAVIGVLASIVIINLSGATQKAKISNVLQWQATTHRFLASDIVGEWNLNEGLNSTCSNGEDVCDTSGRNNHGTNYGAQWRCDKEDTPSGMGCSLLFSAGDQVYIPNTSFNLSEITSMAWIKPDTNTDDRAPITRVDTFYFQFYQNNRLAVYWYGKVSAGYHYSQNNSVSVGEWSYVAVTWDNDGVRFYINGKLDRSVSTTGTGEITNWVRLGYESTSRRYEGLISDARIYSRALSASEISTIYAQTKNNYLALKE